MSTYDCDSASPVTELYLRWLIAYAVGYENGQVTAHEVWVANWWHEAACDREFAAAIAGRRHFERAREAQR